MNMTKLTETLKHIVIARHPGDVLKNEFELALHRAVIAMLYGHDTLAKISSRDKQYGDKVAEFAWFW